MGFTKGGVLRFFRCSARFLLPAFVASLIAIPIALSHALVAHASCYWSSTLNDYRTASPADGITFTSSVDFQIGYDCNLNPSQIYVIHFVDTLSASSGGSDNHHYQQYAYVLKYWAPPDTPIVYNDQSSSSCTGACTLVRERWPYVTFDYYSTGNVYENYYGCSLSGVGWCEFAHEFWIGQLIVHWWA